MFTAKSFSARTEGVGMASEDARSSRPKFQGDERVHGTVLEFSAKLPWEFRRSFVEEQIRSLLAHSRSRGCRAAPPVRRRADRDALLHHRVARRVCRCPPAASLAALPARNRKEAVPDRGFGGFSERRAIASESDSDSRPGRVSRDSGIQRFNRVGTPAHEPHRGEERAAQARE